MEVLVATTSDFRRTCYREILSRSFTVRLASNGIEAIERSRMIVPNVAILDAGLLWGGVEGILEIYESEPKLGKIEVILVANNASVEELYRLSRYKFADFWLYAPMNADMIRRVQIAAHGLSDVPVYR